MGFLDSDSVTVDAILTKHGRYKLANGEGLNISHFALSDDGVDYTLWNVDHPSGSAKYGEAIEKLPLIEAVPDDTAMLRYKLVDRPADTKFLPYISVTSPITIQVGNTDVGGVPIMPQTLQGGNVGLNENYIFKFTDVSYIAVTPFGGTGQIDVTQGLNYPNIQEIPEPAQYISEYITVSHGEGLESTKFSHVVIEGVDTGAIAHVDITVKPNVPYIPNN